MSEITNDDLARAVRHKLKKVDVRKGIKMVYSEEVTDKKLLPLKEHQIN